MSPIADYEGMTKRDAATWFAIDRERHPERRAWLDRRVGTALTPDRDGLAALWSWWTNWRTSEDFDGTATATLPPRWAGWAGDPTLDGFLTPPELELADAAAFLVADAIQTANAAFEWAVVTRRSSPYLNRPCLVRKGAEVCPVEQIETLATEVAEYAAGTSPVDPIYTLNPERLAATFSSAMEP